MDKNQETFLGLVKAGLWADNNTLEAFETSASTRADHNANHDLFVEVDWSEVYRFAEEQSVIGLISEGIDRFKFQVPSFKIPQEWALQFIGQTLQLEQRNKAMNSFIAKLTEDLRKADVYTLLVKGQGVAQCYEKPLWRACGDVDLLLSNENYEKAKVFLKQRANHIDEEDERKKHLGLTIDNWIVELHGTLYTSFSKRINRQIDNVQSSIFYGGEVRLWDNSGTVVYLPSADNDVILLFTHILEHFFIEGIGLRQICDLCRLLYTYRSKIDTKRLEMRLQKAGIMTEWKAFASLAVDSLGMPKEAMPFYDVDFKGKGERVLKLVLEAGNFGHNKDLSYRTKYKGMTYKIVSLWRRIGDFVQFVPIFPLDAPRFFVTYVFGKVK